MPTSSQHLIKYKPNSLNSLTKAIPVCNKQRKISHSHNRSNAPGLSGPISYKITKVQFAEVTFTSVKNKVQDIAKGSAVVLGKKATKKSKLPSTKNELYLCDFSNSVLLHQFVDRNLGKIIAYNVFIISNNNENDNTKEQVVSHQNLSLLHTAWENRALHEIPLQSKVISSNYLHLSRPILHSNEVLTMNNIKKNSVASLDKHPIDTFVRRNNISHTPEAIRPPSVKCNDSSVVGLPSEDRPRTARLDNRSTPFDVIKSHLKTDALNMSSMQLAMPKKDIWKCLIGELIGTALLIIIGCGSALSLELPKALSLTGIALCWGFTVATLAQALGHVSGCHINPAVTLAMMVTGKIEVIKAGLYVVVQCIGALIGTAVLKALTPEGIFGDWGATQLHKDVSALQGCGIEFVSTFVLVLVIFGATDENRNDLKGSAPLAIGLAVSCIIMFAGPFTGASLNPARSLGPSVVGGNWDNHWVYWIGPIAGGLVAGTLYQQLLRALSTAEIEANKQANEERQRNIDTKEGSVPNV